MLIQVGVFPINTGKFNWEHGRGWGRCKRRGPSHQALFVVGLGYSMAQHCRELVEGHNDTSNIHVKPSPTGPGKHWFMDPVGLIPLFFS
jgi:hypothetical protein